MNDKCACGKVAFLDLAFNPYLALKHSLTECAVPWTMPTIPPLTGTALVKR